MPWQTPDVCCAAVLKRVLVVVLLPALAGCGAGSAAGSVETRSDSAGIQIVDYHGDDLVLPWSFTPVWSVGGSSDDRLPLVELGVHQLSVGPAGHVAILDEAGYRVLLFSPEGEFLNAIGREGGGPGELLSPAALTHQDDGTIVVYDVGKQALVRWSSDGEFYAETGMAVPFWGPKLKVDSRGNVIFTALGAGDADTSEQWLVEWNADRELRLAHFRRMADRIADFSVCGFAELPIAPLIAPELNWDAWAGRVAFNADVAYRIDVMEAGRTVLSIRRDVPVRAVTEDMAFAEAGDGLPIPLANCTVPPAVLVREQGYAAVVPTIADLVISPEAELWVKRRVVRNEPGRIDVFSRDGAYLGTLPPEAPFPAAFLPDGRIIALEPDPFDAPRMVAYSITRR